MDGLTQSKHRHEGQLTRKSLVLSYERSIVQVPEHFIDLMYTPTNRTLLDNCWNGVIDDCYFFT